MTDSSLLNPLREEKSFLKGLFYLWMLSQTTRMCEAGVNVKVIQDALGHKDVSTTLNIYTDVTKELRKSEFEGLELQFNQ